MTIAARILGPILFATLLAGGCQTVGGFAMLDPADAEARVPGDVEVRVEEHLVEGVDAGEGAVAVLTLPEAVRRAVLHDPRLQSALARVRMADADALQSTLLPNPVVSLSIRLSEGGADPIFDAGLAADLVSILQRPRKMSAADARLRGAVAEVLTALADVVADAQQAYFAVQALTGQLAALEERRKLADRLLQLGQARLKAGETGSLDVIALQTQLMDLEVSLSEKRQDRTEARLNLARLMGEPSADASWELTTWSPPPATRAPERAWIAEALENRSELRAKEWELAALGDELALTRWMAWEGSDVGAQAEWDQRWSVGPAVTTPLPIFDWGQAKRGKAGAAVLDARHQMTLIQRQVVQEVRAQYANFGATLQTLALARDQLLPLQERRAAQAEASYRAGETDIANLLLAEEDLLDTRIKVIELQNKTAVARVKLQRAVGGVRIAERLEATTRPTQPTTREQP
jgi:outer membrane protein TolC